MMVVDAGFPIPKDVEVVDISLSENNPMVLWKMKNYILTDDKY
jgi:D-ribose pyranose/furanose isomerase RbsD